MIKQTCTTKLRSSVKKDPRQVKSRYLDLTRVHESIDTCSYSEDVFQDHSRWGAIVCTNLNGKHHRNYHALHSRLFLKW